MSYSSPSSNTITISSGDQEIASGTFKLELILKDDDNVFANSYSMELLDVGGMEVDYNYIDSVGDVDDVKINVPTLEFSLSDIVTNSNDSSDSGLFTDMISRLNGSDLIVAKTTYSGRSDYYYTTRQQTEFDYKDRRVKMNVLHPMKYGTPPPGVTWSDSIFSSNVVSLDLVSNEVIFPKTLITKYMRSLSASDVFVYNSDVYTHDETTSFSNLQDTILFLDDYTLMGELDSFEDATRSVKALSLSEAAIIGNILGYSFYMPRYETSTAYRVMLTIDDFEELKLEYAYKDARYFDVKVDFGSLTNDLSSNTTINELGSSDVSINFTPLNTVSGLTGAKFNSSNSVFTSSTVNIPTSSVQTSIINGFKDIIRVPRSLGAVDIGSVISGKIFGIETLNPYQFFYVDSTAIHPLVNQRRFRPSYLKYDIKNDLIEFEAYEF